MPAGLRIHAGLGKNTLFLRSALSGKKRKIFRQPIHPLTDGGDPLVCWGKLCVVGKRGSPTLRGGVTGLQAGKHSKAVPRQFAARSCNPACSTGATTASGRMPRPPKNRGPLLCEALVPPRSAGANCRGFRLYWNGLGQSENCAGGRTDLHRPTDFPAGRGRHHCRPKPVAPATHQVRTKPAMVSTTPRPGAVCALLARTVTGPTTLMCQEFEPGT